MVGCSIKNCRSRSVKGGTVSFFSFPVNESVANEWLRYCGPKTTIKNGRVCANHFLPSDYIKTLRDTLMKESPRKDRKIKPDVIPTLMIDDTDKLEADKQDNRHMLVDNSETMTIELNPLGIISKINTEIYDTEGHSIPVTDVADSSDVVKEIYTECTDRKSGTDSHKALLQDNIEKGEEKITISVAEYKLLNKRVNEYNNLRNNLDQIFTPGQIRCLMKTERNISKRVKWCAEDIVSAISLRNISPEGYHHLRDTVGIPLPSYSTLCKWVSKFEIVQVENYEEH